MTAIQDAGGPSSKPPRFRLSPRKNVPELAITSHDLRALDPSAMYESLSRVPGQVALASELFDSGHLLSRPKPDSVLLVGMGGSAAASDFASAVFRPDSAVPCVVSRGSDLPGWVGPDTLVIVTSWSGDTLEAVHAARSAHALGADLVLIASGGQLGQIASEVGVTVLRTPGGMMPRLALTLMFGLTARVLAARGVVSETRVSSQLHGLGRHLGAVVEQCALEVPTRDNPAKQLAAVIGGGSPIFMAAGAMAVVARRWKEQVNENAKRWAHAETLPSAHHNALIAIEDAARRSMPIIVLEADLDAELNDVVFADVPSWVTRVVVEDAASVRSLLSAALLGDYMSVYLALAAGVDPTPVEIVNRIKAALDAQH